MKKLINALLALALAAQLAVPMTAMAEGEAEATTTSSYSINFDTGIDLDKNEEKDGMGFQYFKGQYGKGKDDTSLRVYSLGKAIASQNTYLLTHDFPAAVQGDENNNIAHVSFEYLLEDAGSGHRIELVGQKSDGESTYVTLINHDRRYPTAPILCNKADGTYSIGSWAKIDVYFTSGATGATVFNNGTPYDVTAADFSALVNMTGIQIKHSHFTADETASPIASAVQYDNFKFEYVSEIPGAQEEYRYIGESFNFDDGFVYSAGINGYPLKNNDKTINKFTNNYANPRALYFYGVDGSISFEDGIGGNPAWDTSYHYTNAGTKSHVMTYRTGVTDLKSGDYGHLSFMINAKGKYAFAQINTPEYPMTFSDGSTLNQTIFDFGSTRYDGLTTFKFFGQDSGKANALNTWYKIDMVYKIGNGTNTYTTVDCYVDGEKVLADVEVKPESGSYEAVLNHIGALNFVNPETADVYFDDVAFGVFKADTLHDPADGYSIEANNDVIGSCIDNANRVIILDEGYAVDKFLSEVDGNVTVYNDEGLIVTTGTMGGCSVKVSNGFGGGVWYDIADSAVILEDNFNNGIPNSKLTNIFNYNDEGLYFNNPTAAGGLGGKAEDDLALELDEATTRTQAITEDRGYVQSIGEWKSNTVVLEGSFLLKSADSRLVMQAAANKLNSNLNYIIDFRANGEMRTMFRSGSIDELWKENRWYKIAAVMEYGSRNIQIYLNGDEIWNGEYVQLVDENVDAFVEGGSGFECLSRIRFLYDGQVAMDNIRISYGAYDPTKDKIEILSDSFVVNNEKSIIGFDGGVVDYDWPAEELLDSFEEVDMKVYTDGTLTTSADEITEDTIALVSKGEVFKYYEMGYITKQVLKPTIKNVWGDLTATAELEETALKTPTSTAVLILAVYGENGLERVKPVTVIDVADAKEDDLTVTIDSVDMEGKTAKAFLWDTTSSMIPLYEAVDFSSEIEE